MIKMTTSIIAKLIKTDKTYINIVSSLLNHKNKPQEQDIHKQNMLRIRSKEAQFYKIP